eukprot:TRINITY_DN3171_c0_g1_i1.p1 TRINITY_DN3171_c0_g1~~TRINITY_DN3171_c0_g1_i1.p1  ORF type:complete len:359 (-),score=80.48 TRINITY_DN3171_c0_g1_i1:249-1325(-)
MMYMSAIMAAAPASEQRAQELANTRAQVVVRVKMSKDGTPPKPQRAMDLLSQCLAARSAEYATLERWVWNAWSKHADYEGTPPHFLGDADAVVIARARWWLKGRRYNKLKLARLGLYEVMVQSVDRYAVSDARTDELHKGRCILKLTLAQSSNAMTKIRSHLISLGFTTKELMEMNGGMRPSHRAYFCEELAWLHASAKLRDTVWVRLFSTDVDVKGSGTVTDVESTQGVRVRSFRDGARRQSTGDRKLQREMLRVLSEDVDEESDWASDEDVSIVPDAPAVDEADDSIQQRRRQRLMSTRPVAGRASNSWVRVKAEPEVGGGAGGSEGSGQSGESEESGGDSEESDEDAVSYDDKSD